MGNKITTKEIVKNYTQLIECPILLTFTNLKTKDFSFLDFFQCTAFSSLSKTLRKFGNLIYAHISVFNICL